MVDSSVELDLRTSDPEELQTFLGETVLWKAKVIRYKNINSRNSGTIGTLYITNFKVAFTSSTHTKCNSSSNLDDVLSEDYNDLIPLTVIHKIFAVSSFKEKRKRIKSARKEVSGQYDVIEIETKDFRVIQYDFQFSSSQQRRTCFQMIYHYAFPTSVGRLFAFDYGNGVSSSYENACAFRSFQCEKDYEISLSRLKASDFWRVVTINKHFDVCKTLSLIFVCPVSMEDEDIISASKHYQHKRLPIWVWTYPGNGSSLLISSYLEHEKDGSGMAHPKAMMESLSQSEEDFSIIFYDLASIENFPSLKQLQLNFKKMRKLLLFHSSKEFWASDSNWLEGLEESSWLKDVSSCLGVANELASKIKETKVHIILQENSGSDFAILLASLVQILLDPFSRTYIGFQALIQKDWVMNGHNFSNRLGNIVSLKKNSEVVTESPVFLLFLDCLHQLINQQPLMFEFMDEYLILLMDCAHSSLFDTFLFNCQLDCVTNCTDTNLISVWDFIAANIPKTQFNDAFTNLAFELKESSSNDSMECCFENGLSKSIDPVFNISNLVFWTGYFLRWICCTDLQKGFCSKVMLHLQQKQFIEEVKYLEDRLLQLQNATTSNTFQKQSNDHESGHVHNEVKEDFLTATSGFYFFKLL